MSKVALLPRPARSAAAETPSLTSADLTTLPGDEPRVPDLSLARRLGFLHPHDIRQLITRNRGELQGYGDIRCGTENSRRRGRPGREYHLNEGQALLICALARTTMAARIRRELITVFMEYRRGTFAPPKPEPVLVKPDVSAIIATVSTLADQLQALCNGQSSSPQPDARREVAPLDPEPQLRLPAPAPDPELLYGVREIQGFLGLRKERQARHLCEKGSLPTFKLPGSSIICARRSTLTAWLASVEAARNGEAR